MSESPGGPDWWRASDGRWYPPHLHPNRQGRAAARVVPSAGGSASPKSGTAELESKGFVASLFDIGFDSFVTMRVLRVFYVIILVGLTLGALGLVAIGLSDDASIETLLVPIVYVFAVLTTRVWFELTALSFRVADDLRAIRRRGDRI